MRPTLFLDCDGVLNEEVGGAGVTRPEQLVLIPGAGEAVARLNRAGILAVAVTNRAAVARGLIGLDTLDMIFGRLRALLAEGGGVLDGLYFCPHLPPPAPDGSDSRFIQDCECRKPRPGMLVRAATELSVDRGRAALLGDTTRDIGAARAFGIPAWGVRTGHACADSSVREVTPDRWFSSIAEAADAAVSCWESVFTSPRE